MLLSPLRKKIVCYLLVCLLGKYHHVSAQNYEVRSVLYNTLVGGFSGGIGSILNHAKKAKRVKVFLNGFLAGCGGGTLMYGGKKLNLVIARQRNISYAWLSRAIFCAGNSIVENASAGRPWWSQFHYDVGFVRFEFRSSGSGPVCRPSIMLLSFGSFLFTTLHGHFDAKSSLQSGALVFTTSQITYARYLVGSTTGNNILFTDTLFKNKTYHAIFAHEMVHTFQFQELSGANYFFNPITIRKDHSSRTFKQINQWVYGDVNYLLMLGNYFLVQGGLERDRYCKNFLENEAEVLTTGRVSCP